MPVGAKLFPISVNQLNKYSAKISPKNSGFEPE